MLENVAGMCSMSCNMCPIDEYPRQEIMSYDIFEKVINKLEKWRDNINFFSIVGLGESLLDKGIIKKIQLLKNKEFKGIGVYTNATPLTEKISMNLLKSELDSLLVSIDGFTDNTQNKIRVGGDHIKIKNNLLRFIKLRNTNNFNTKIIIRFTEQDLNIGEYNDFYRYWSKQLDFSKGDLILKYSLHNHGVLIDTSKLLKNSSLSLIKSNKPLVKCKEINERLTILSDGTIGLCCGDHLAKVKTGNILTGDPVEIYNQGNHLIYRSAFETGDFTNAKLCIGCTVMDSILSKQTGDLIES
jgi:hypothetical protein